MKRTSYLLALAATMAVLPAGVASAAADPAGVSVGGITYTVPVSAGAGVNGQCTIVADRWTMDYGPTHVYATAASPLGIWTRIRCTVTKNGTTYVDQEGIEYGPYVVVDAGDGTIPVEGVRVCAEIESQYTVDVRPSNIACRTF